MTNNQSIRLNQRPLLPALGCLLLLVVLLVRSWPTLSHQTFYMEDALLFSRYYGGVIPFSDVAAKHFGQPYITLLANTFSWFYANVDVRWQAHLYQWTGFICGIAAAALLFFSGLIRSRTILIFGPLLMGLTAINDIFFYNTLIYVMYSLVLILLGLLFFPEPKTRVGAFILLLAVVVLPWSGPYSVLAVPTALFMLLLFRDCRRKRWLLVAAVGSTLLYYTTVSGSTTRLEHLQQLWVIRYYLQVLLERIVFMDQFGHISEWWWLPVLAVIGSALWLFRREEQFIKIALVMFALITMSLALFFLSIKLPLYLFPLSGHLVISLYFWCFFILLLVDRLLTTYGYRIPCSTLLVTGLLLGLVIRDNLHQPHKFKADPIPETEAFLSEVHRLEQMQLEKSGSYVILRLEHTSTPIMFPEVMVGSRKTGAKQLGPEAFEQGRKSPFIVDP